MKRVALESPGYGLCRLLGGRLLRLLAAVDDF